MCIAVKIQKKTPTFPGLSKSKDLTEGPNRTHLPMFFIERTKTWRAADEATAVAEGKFCHQRAGVLSN